MQSIKNVSFSFFPDCLHLVSFSLYEWKEKRLWKRQAWYSRRDRHTISQSWKNHSMRGYHSIEYNQGIYWRTLWRRLSREEELSSLQNMHVLPLISFLSFSSPSSSVIFSLPDSLSSWTRAAFKTTWKNERNVDVFLADQGNAGRTDRETGRKRGREREKRDK